MTGPGGGMLVSYSDAELWEAERASPATVLHPFGGIGTIGFVAERLSRDCNLIEINPDYANMALNRIADEAPPRAWSQIAA